MKNLICIILFSTFLNACGGSYNMTKSLQGEQSNGSLDTPLAPPSSSTPDEPTNDNFFKPTICSKLSFTNVTWPDNLTPLEINSYAMAMNITGSFEGSAGWKNLTNNFDGQGISLGLFNQNLGQGSLQPLMIKLRNNKNAAMRRVYSSTQYDSVNKMLTQWGGSAVVNTLTKATPYNFYERNTSDLDDPSLLSEEDISEQEVEFNGLTKALTSKNQASVDWAVSTVFNGSSFKPEWKLALQNMAGSPEFISYQIEAAETIHAKAISYMKKFNFRELRAYLFFFDIVVQNGGITTSIENKYLAWVKTNASASEAVKLKKMLEYRLTIVKSIYVNDVRSRKNAMIDGVGTVHGSKRDFRKEYCGPSWSTLFP